jgi:hypothetical protein
MNDQLKDLKEESLLWAIDNLDPETVGEHDWAVAIDEKFAELIIQECARIVDSDAESRPYATFGIKIKEHFGVK